MATPVHRRGTLSTKTVLKRLGSRRRLAVGAAGLLLAVGALAGHVRAAGSAGEVLYNGIRLPSTWPPQPDQLTLDPVPAPYLEGPPAVIPIDVGRQLLVDDFLIEQTTLKRTFHPAEYHSANPVLEPDKPWEHEGSRPGACAMPFSDGVWYDPQDRLFKMWYMGGYVYHTCYATSRDGIHWEKPELDVRPGTNVVDAPRDLERFGKDQTQYHDSCTVWLDLEEKDPQKRYKMALFTPVTRNGALSVFYSPDGIHWKQVGRTGNCGDRSTMFYNPFRKVWVYSLRDYWQPKIEGKLRRFRRYREGRDLVAATANWKVRTDVNLWFVLDRIDARRVDLDPDHIGLYNLDAVAYESVMLGLFSILQVGPRDDPDRPKINEVFVGFSRDGWHWHRPFERPLIPVSDHRGDWNWGNVQSAGGCCLVVGDKLYFYVSGRAGKRPGIDSKEAVCSTGLATLRRDGFASMDADSTEGTLTTRPVRFSGRYCFVNADVDTGELRVEILDAEGRVIQPFSRANCVAVRSDSTLQAVTWPGASDLSTLAGQTVRFRFYLTNGGLYAFWVSPDRSGASHGYVAAGGPGFTGPTDTVGLAAYREAWPQ